MFIKIYFFDVAAVWLANCLPCEMVNSTYSQDVSSADVCWVQHGLIALSPNNINSCHWNVPSNC